MLTPRSTALLIPFVALAGLASCAKSEKTANTDSAAPAAATASASTEPTLVTITASDYAYDAPDTITAGIVTLKLVNKGPELHHVQIFRLTGGKTYDEFVTGMKSMKPGSPPPPWIEDVAGPNAPVPGGEQSLTQELTPGSYVLICMIPSPDHMPHFTKGMMKSLTVVPATGAIAAAPIADVRVAMSDYAWDVTPTISAGKHMIRLENNAEQSHEMFIVRLAPGKTAMDFANWTDTMNGPPPGTPMGGASGMKKGAVAYVSVDLPAGEYAMICFLPDAKDGKPHFVHGMMKSFSVS